MKLDYPTFIPVGDKPILDQLNSLIKIEFGFLDKIKILFGATIEVHIRVDSYKELDIGPSDSHTSVILFDGTSKSFSKGV